MNEIHTKADKMKGVFFLKPERSKRGMVRVQLRDKAGALTVRKWNYTQRRWGKWAPIA